MQNEYTDKFRTELLKLENAFDIIFIDTGAGISAHVVDFVFMASEVLVVLTPEPTAFADAYAMVKVVTHEKPELPVGIIVNMITGDQEGERIFTKFSEIVSRFLGREIYYRGGVLADNAVNEAIRTSGTVSNAQTQYGWPCSRCDVLHEIFLDLKPPPNGAYSSVHERSSAISRDQYTPSNDYNGSSDDQQAGWNAGP